MSALDKAVNEYMISTYRVIKHSGVSVITGTAIYVNQTSQCFTGHKKVKITLVIQHYLLSVLLNVQHTVCKLNIISVFKD